MLQGYAGVLQGFCRGSAWGSAWGSAGVLQGVAWGLRMGSCMGLHLRSYAGLVHGAMQGIDAGQSHGGMRLFRDSQGDWGREMPDVGAWLTSLSDDCRRHAGDVSATSPPHPIESHSDCRWAPGRKRAIQIQRYWWTAQGRGAKACYSVCAR